MFKVALLNKVKNFAGIHLHDNLLQWFASELLQMFRKFHIYSEYKAQ